MRTARLTLFLLLISSGASFSAQSFDVTVLDDWTVDGSYTVQDAAFNASAGTDRIVLVALSAEKNQNGPISVDSVTPGGLVEVAFFDTYPDSDAADFEGAWGVYS